MDDLSTHMMDLGFYRSLPQESRLEEAMARGTTFPNFFNTTPLCCPSRASILTGLFAHNHLVYGNDYYKTDGFGGFEKFDEEGWETRSIGVQLQEEGYETVFIGKYMNGYQRFKTHVPVGWDRWAGRLVARGTGLNIYRNPAFNINGEVVGFGINGPAYLTDIEAEMAVAEIETRFGGPEPVFIHLSATAPHVPATPAARHAGAHEVIEPPQPPPSCEEADISDKPEMVAQFKDAYQKGLRFDFDDCWGPEYLAHLDQTLALDELIGEIMDAVAASPDAANTYIVIASDNGRMRGEHWITTKGVPYEESVRTPMIVIGPGVAPGATDPALVLNLDLAATFLDIAGGDPTRMDGESMRDLWSGTETDARASVLLELLVPLGNGRTPVWRALRTADLIYIEYESGHTELYDLIADPWQVESLHDQVPQATLEELSAVLAVWADCAGNECREAGRLGVPGR